MLMTGADYLFSKASKNKVPLAGTFELTPVCNFSCKMCYVRKTPAIIKKEGKHLLSADEWLKLARECHKAGTLYLLLTGGEPFAYPEFKKLYTELHKMGFILSINTNGSLIDEETVEWLKKYAPSRINITLYGASAETYGKICGNTDGYEKAVRTIKLLKNAGIAVVINGSMTPENYDDLEKIADFGKNLELNTRISPYMFPPVRRDAEKGDSRLTPEQASSCYIRRIECQLAEDQQKKLIENLLKKSSEHSSETWGVQDEFMQCRAGRSAYWISWEGKMTACGMMDFPTVTYPLENSFADCWNELTEKVRSASVMKECSECNLREICRPCAAMLYSESGDVNKKSEYLCKMSECIYDKLREKYNETEI